MVYIIVKARESDAKVDPAFRADSIETAAKVSTLIRTFGHAQAEISAVTEWQRFKEVVRYLPSMTGQVGTLGV
ncbi:hypothetical protein [Microvirga sp. P5_D2]